MKCNKCSKVLTFETGRIAYYKEDGSVKFHSTCKECQNTIRKYQNHNPARFDKLRENVKSNREYIKEYKESRPCKDCNNKFPHYVMDFDHLPQYVKSFEVALAKGKLLADIVTEIRKCDLVCSNCHRIRTFKRSQEK